MLLEFLAVGENIFNGFWPFCLCHPRGNFRGDDVPKESASPIFSVWSWVAGELSALASDGGVHSRLWLGGDSGAVVEA